MAGSQGNPGNQGPSGPSGPGSTNTWGGGASAGYFTHLAGGITFYIQWIYGGSGSFSWPITFPNAFVAGACASDSSSTDGASNKLYSCTTSGGNKNFYSSGNGWVIAIGY